MSENNDTKKSTNKFSPILPFDVTVGENFAMYQNPTYHRDISLFDNNEQMMERGNVIHAYRCNFQEARPIGGDVAATAEETDAEEASEDATLQAE